jgi:lipopolysaccharide transport system ATP-binding protein
MDNYAIRIDSLGKMYRINPGESENKNKISGLFSFFSDSIKNVRDSIRPPNENEILWALRNISFDIKQGETVGIIGQNGAGKSTLLKLLSRIIHPTEGRFELYGRTASLIEVGTGFHPDLTGRENIYINGTIMGMKAEDINRKFDDIVEFSGVGKFIDTPVKYYSSGMYVRLGFSVAAHLEPDILIVDEVLAVGDEGFRKKSRGKMESMTGEGRTILYVSHNLPSVIAICNRCIWLEKGELKADGRTIEVVQKYLEQTTSTNSESEIDFQKVHHYGNGRARFIDVQICPTNQKSTSNSIIQTGSDLLIKTTIEAFEEITETVVAVVIYDSSGYRIIDANTGLEGHYLSLKSKQKATVTFRLNNLLLKPGTYRVGLWIGRPNVYDIDGITYAKQFTISFDPTTIKSPIEYPGVYQCNFTDLIEILN